MNDNLLNHHLNILEQRFQALRDQAGGLPGARDALEPALQEVAQALVAVRAAQEAGGSPIKDGLGDQMELPPQPEAIPRACDSMLRQILNAVPDLLSVIDRDFNILTTNWHGFNVMKETAASGLLKCYQLFHHLDRPCEDCHIPHLLATGEPYIVEKIDSFEGRIYKITAFPILDQSRQIIMVAEHTQDITVFRQAQESLKESEELYRVLTERSLAGVYLLQDGKFRYANPTMAQIFGYAPEEIINRLSPRDLIHPEDHPLLDEQIRRRLSGEAEEAYYSARGVRRDGTIIHLELLGRRVEYQGRPAIIGTLLDITERRQADEALYTQTRILDSMAEAVCIVDQDAGLVFANPAAYALFGYQDGELIGQDVSGLIFMPATEKNEFFREILGQLQTSGVWVGEVRNRKKDGTAFVAHAHASTLDLPGKKLFVSVLEDITAKKHLEEALKGYLQFIHILLETIPNPIFYKDFQGIILRCNRAFAEFLGVPQQEIAGKAMYDLFPGELARICEEMDEEVLQHPATKVYKELRLSAADGSPRQVVCHNSALIESSGSIGGVVSVLTDITELKQVQDTLRGREATLRTLIEGNPESLFLLDTQGVILASSKVGAQRLGKPLDKIIGADIFALLPPDVAKKRFDLFQQIVATGQPMNYEDSRGDYHFIEQINPILTQDKVVQVAVMAVDISGRKLAEEALRESEERYRTLFETSPHATVLMDLQLNITMANQRGLQLFGYDSLEEVMAINGLDHIAPEDQPHVLPLIQEMFETGESHSSYLNVVKKDGTKVPCLVTSSLIRNAAGTPKAIITVIQDISDLKRAEEAVQESEARLRSIFEHAPVGITMVDATGRFLQANPAYQEIVGYSAAELQGMNWQQITHPEDVSGNVELQEELFAAKRQYYSIEKRYLRKDGEIVWVSVGLSRLRNARGELRVVGTILDVTERKRAEEALRESEQRFRLMAETIQDVFWIATPGMAKTKYVSPRYEQVWGRTREEIYQSAQTFLEAIHPEDRQRVKSETFAAHDRGEAFNLEYRIIMPDGEVRWIRDRGFPVRNEQGDVILFTGVATDITDRKTLEGQLLLAQKMEAVGRLAGGVAHDFNNILMAIAGYGELMRAKVLKGDPLYNYLNDIIKATDRAAALTGQLLTFSRRQIVHPKVIDLNRVVFDLERMLRRLIEEDIELNLIAAPELGTVKADPGYLNQIIMNLVVNARDAMPCGGCITLKTAAVDLEESRRTRSGLATPGPYVVLEVSDTGLGMDESIQAHIFEPFFTTKEPGKGTGLGLSTVYGIVKQSGGFIDLDSEPGKGSTFTIYLPRLNAAVKPTKTKVPKPTEFRGEETILLVEDEDLLRTLLAKYLRHHGYTVLEARHGGEALMICKQHQGPIHMMVTDVVMPKMSGRVLADHLTPLHPEMKVLFMSGYTEDDVVQRGVADLSVAFLQKPFRPIDLARQVGIVLHPPARG